MSMLKQKVVLITGAGSGVGRMTALACAREGARVAVVDLDTSSGEETVRLVQATDAEAVFIQADVSQAEEMEAAVRRTAAAFGRLDCAFNNAGIVIDEQVRLADFEEAAWNKTLAVNLSAVWLGMKCEIPAMLRAGGGVIVNNFYAYIGCVAGAILIDDYRAGLEVAGFGSVEIIDSGLDLSVYTKLGDQMCCGQAAEDQGLFARFKELIARFDVNQYAASVRVSAVKPIPDQGQT
jgi:hypothetical protein